MTTTPVDVPDWDVISTKYNIIVRIGDTYYTAVDFARALYDGRLSDDKYLEFYKEHVMPYLILRVLTSQ